MVHNQIMSAEDLLFDEEPIFFGRLPGLIEPIEGIVKSQELIPVERVLGALAVEHPDAA